jgi:DNA gyrase subunit A
VAGEDALLSASISPTGFVRGGKTVRAENRAKASVKGPGTEVSPAP